MDKEKTMEMDEMLEQRVMENFANKNSGNFEVSDERLKEMNKKLPSWSLEPPFSFLK